MAFDTLSLAQRRFIKESSSRINVADGAIRSGKTLAQLLRWLIYVADAPRGELVVVGRTTHSVARNVFAQLADPDLFDESITKTIRYVAGAPTGEILGRRVHVIGANDARAEAKIRGFTCAGALVDEATLVGREFFTQLLGRMSVPNAKLFATTNADSPQHWLKEGFLDREDEMDLYRLQFSLHDNPSLTQDYKDAIESEFTGLFYRRMVLGEWVTAEGAIFDMFDPARHVVSAFPAITEFIAAGIDYGTTNPFHAVLLGLGIDNNLYAVSEYRYDASKEHRQATDAEYSVYLRNWMENQEVNGQRVIATPRSIRLDPSAASFRQQLFRDHMSPMYADNSVQDSIRVISQLFATGKLFIGKDCPILTKELQGYVWDQAAAEKGVEQPMKVADHGVDALRYAVYSTRHSWKTRVGLKTV